MLKVKVTQVSKIKRKKPWPKLKWIGLKKESLCIHDKKRLSLLYLPSGRTQRVPPALHPYMKDVVLINTSSNGWYLNKDN